MQAYHRCYGDIWLSAAQIPFLMLEIGKLPNPGGIMAHG
jgi:hypothetical protein